MVAIFRWVINTLCSLFTALLKMIFGLFGINDSFLSSTRFSESVKFFFADSIVIFFMILVITFFVALIRSFFPPERTRKLLGEQGKAKGILGNIAAALLGVVTPFCSCSAVPVFIGFIEAGIPLGTTFSFLISSPNGQRSRHRPSLGPFRLEDRLAVYRYGINSGNYLRGHYRKAENGKISCGRCLYDASR